MGLSCTATDSPVTKVLCHVADCRSRTDWYPGTPGTTPMAGDRAVGAGCPTMSRFLVRSSELAHLREQVEPEGLLRLRGVRGRVAA